MSIPTQDFSKRLFEFSWNTKYAHRNRAVLANVPSTPTHGEEKSLDYDAFKVAQRGAAIDIAVLHQKVSRYVKSLWQYFGFSLLVEVRI